MDLPVLPPVAPMLAKSVAKIPAGAMSYEPKWDGFRSIIFRDGDEVEIGSRNERPMTRYFPEIVAAVRESLPERCVIDGEIIIPDADGRRLDFEALLQRIHPADSRVRLLAEQTPAAFVAFDLLALGDDDHTAEPFARRRELLEQALAGARAPVYLTPATTDAGLAEVWFSQFEGAGLDGVIAKPLDGDYQPDKRLMFKIKHERTADCVVAGYRVHKSGDDAIGSLLLGLYDDSGKLASIGVIGAFPMARRKELFTELQPLVTGFDGHPWNWAARAEGARNPRAAEASRWNAGKDLSFVPLRPERVVEVRYDHMEGTRFRHTAQFVRWRPDREPESCGFGQLEEPVSFNLADILAGSVCVRKVGLALVIALLAGGCVAAPGTAAPAAPGARPRPPTASAAAHTRRAAGTASPGPGAGRRPVIGVWGSYPVGQRRITFTEPARPAAGGGSLPARRLLTEIRYPLAGPAGKTSRAASGPFPMIMFAPGFMQCGGPYSRLLQYLATAGYVVVVVDFPHSDCEVGTAATESDLANQPHDVSYVITRVLRLSKAGQGMFAGLLDSHQIALAGQSDGGVTVAAIAANSCCTDPRIATVAVESGSVWPPMAGRYFTTKTVPILFSQGSADTINPPGCSVTMYLADRAQARYYLDLYGASHTEPYWGRNRFERIVARVTLAFFDRYVLGQAKAGPAIQRLGTVSGLASTFANGHGKLTARYCNT